MAETNKKQNQIFIIGLSMIIIFSSVLTFSISVVVLQAILGLITVLFCLKDDYKTKKLWLRILVVSMIFMFLIFVANQFYYGQPYYLGGSDDLYFEKLGFDIYNSGVYNPQIALENGILNQFNNSSFFCVYIGAIIKFSKLFDGYITFLPRIANIYFLLWICMILKYLFEKYTGLSKKAICYSLVCFAFMPNIQYINAHIFRDVFNLLQILLIVLFVDIVLTNSNFMIKIISLILLPFLIYGTYFTRAGSIAFAIMISAFTISSIYKIKKKYFVCILIIILFASGAFEFFKIDYFIETYTNYVVGLARDGLSRVVFSTALFPYGIFLRSAYGLISPFPNFFNLFQEESKFLLDIVQCLINLGVILQILVIPFFIKRAMKLDWLVLVFFGCFFSVIITTFTFRHVLLYYPFFVAIVVDGYMNTSLNLRKTILFFSCLGLIFIFLIYVILKI